MEVALADALHVLIEVQHIWEMRKQGKTLRNVNGMRLLFRRVLDKQFAGAERTNHIFTLLLRRVDAVARSFHFIRLLPGTRRVPTTEDDQDAMISRRNRYQNALRRF